MKALRHRRCLIQLALKEVVVIDPNGVTYSTMGQNLISLSIYLVEFLQARDKLV